MYQDQWESLKASINESGYRLLRISSECKLELFLAKDSLDHRCLLLVIPKSCNLNFKQIDKSHISLKFEEGFSYLTLKLLDSDFYDLFDDLIYSIYTAIKTESLIPTASSIFISTFIKWNVFFEKTQERELSKSQVIGIYGELIKLEQIISKCSPISINELLSSWRGPYGDTHDFEFKDQSIEVKTKLESSNTINIASEYQLERKDNLPLYLLLINMQEDHIKGSPLSKLYFDIKEIIVKHNGKLELLLTALNEICLNEQSVKLYDNWRFIPTESCLYNCEASDFPKLIPSTLNNSIKDVSYAIQLNELNSFVLKKDEF